LVVTGQRRERALLSIRGLAKSYGETVALRHVDLEIRRGEICGLLGPNGVGKSTLVSIVAGLRRADSGQVFVGDIDALNNSASARKLIGLAPQELGIYPTVRVRENLAFFGELAGIWGAQLRRRIDEVAAELDLAHLLDRFARTLSGGEKRRLHTAMALLHKPPLLLLDEPTTGVDVATRSRVLEAIRRLAREERCAVCYTTHYLAEVEALGASVAIMDDGRVIARGSAAELVAAHSEPAIELVFDGEPPTIHIKNRMKVKDSTVRIYAQDAARFAPSLLHSLGPDVSRLRRMDVVTESLEGVFLALTGRRFSSDGERDEK
jgi:ABC-2 type transport system ATP-binding protein